jgi:hypothetical protein
MLFFMNVALRYSFFNCTDVQTGRRVVLAPIKLAADDAEYPLQAESASRIRISTAAMLSARFPVISPVGYMRTAGKTIALVDGGYFDNTGSVTMARVVTALVDVIENRSACVLKVVKPIYVEKNANKSDVTPSSWELGPILHALTAVLGAKSSSDEDWLQAKSAAENKIEIQDSIEIKVEEDETNNKLPLGWFISKDSRDYIRKRISPQVLNQPVI